MISLKKKKVLITGGNGFLGSWVIKELKKEGVEQIIAPTSQMYDLREKSACKEVVKNCDFLIHLAAHVGGIAMNYDHPGQLFYDNAIMGIQLLEEARLANVKKMVIIGTACSYPKYCPIPFHEEDLWSGYPEEVTGTYGLAKKMLLVQAQAYRKEYNFNSIYLILANLFGPNDNFDPRYGHVIPSLIGKMTDAKIKHSKKYSVWGSGQATREFLYVEDAARGIVAALKKYDGPEPINLCTGHEISIRDLVNTLVTIIGYKGKIVWDITKPDGHPRRSLDPSRAKKMFNFEANTSLKEGLEKTYKWYIKQLPK